MTATTTQFTWDTESVKYQSGEIAMVGDEVEYGINRDCTKQFTVDGIWLLNSTDKTPVLWSPKGTWIRPETARLVRRKSPPFDPRTLDCRGVFEVAKCRGCGEELARNYYVTDGCPCNSPRGINHGLVAKDVCACDECRGFSDAAAPSREWIERMAAAEDGKCVTAISPAMLEIATAPPAEQTATEGDAPQWCKDAALEVNPKYCSDEHNLKQCAAIIARHARAAQGGEAVADRDIEWWQALCLVDNVAPTPEAVKKWVLIEQEYATEQLRAQLAERDGEIAALRASQDDKQSYIDQLRKVADWLAGYVGDAAYGAPIELAVRLLDGMIDKLRAEAGAMRLALQAVVDTFEGCCPENIESGVWERACAALSSTAGTDLLERLATVEKELRVKSWLVDDMYAKILEAAGVSDDANGKFGYVPALKVLTDQLAEIRQRAERANDTEAQTANLRKTIKDVLEDATRTLCYEVRRDAEKQLADLSAGRGGEGE